MKTEKEIREVRKDSKKGITECYESDPDGSLRYEGWVEALTWVLQKPKPTKEEKKMAKQIKKVKKAIWEDQFYGNYMQKLNGADVKVEIDPDTFEDFMAGLEVYPDGDEELMVSVTLIYDSGNDSGCRDLVERDKVYYEKKFIKEKLDE